MTPQVYDDIERDEGLRLGAYRDTVGRWTDGFGNAEGVRPGDRVTYAQAVADLHTNVAEAMAQLDQDQPWWRTLNDVRQNAMIELTFNMGIGTLDTFHHSLDAIRAGNWVSAAAQLKASKWNGQVGARAARLENMILTGAYP